jgi:tungstate transport system substrate-binding protein
MHSGTTISNAPEWLYGRKHKGDKVKKILISAVLILIICTQANAAGKGGFVLLASTIGPVDSGVIDALEQGFLKDTGITVRHISAGTGAALDIARKCQVDILIVHAKELEDKFVADGFGTERMALMYNDFVIVGTAADPACIKGMKSASEAFTAIAGKNAKFLTRGDKSGTNIAELAIWKKAGIVPQGAWYFKGLKGEKGNTETLKEASDEHAYTIIDRATWLGAGKETKLEVLVEGDEALINHISVIPVNPAKCKDVSAKDALSFAAWLTAPDKGQKIIKTFGADKYGQALFVPESKAYLKNK